MIKFVTVLYKGLVIMVFCVVIVAYEDQLLAETSSCEFSCCGIGVKKKIDCLFLIIQSITALYKGLVTM